MNTSQLNDILFSHPHASKYFIGTYPCDLLPASIPSICSLAINTDPHDKPGQHWIAAFVRNNTCHIFDSFGGIPKVPDITRFCNRFKRVLFNGLPIQDVSETTCGGYVVYSICMMSQGRSLRSIVHHFKKHPADDSFIREYLREAHAFSLQS